MLVKYTLSIHDFFLSNADMWNRTEKSLWYLTFKTYKGFNILLLLSEMKSVHWGSRARAGKGGGGRSLLRRGGRRQREGGEWRNGKREVGWSRRCRRRWMFNVVGNAYAGCTHGKRTADHCILQSFIQFRRFIGFKNSKKFWFLIWKRENNRGQLSPFLRAAIRASPSCSLKVAIFASWTEHRT